MESLGSKLRKIRVTNDLTMEELSERFKRKQGLNVNKGMISRWENNKSEPVNTYLSAYAKEFGIDLNYLLGIKDDLEFIAIAEPLGEYQYIEDPVAAGSPEEIRAQNNYTTIQIPKSFLGKYANNDKIIIMKVNGSSMNKVIPDGSLIGILPYQSKFDIKDGDIVVSHDESYGYTVKRFYKQDSKIILRPESTDPGFTDIVLNLEEENIKILGKVIMYNVLLED